MSPYKLSKILLTLLITVYLAACATGGGGGSSSKTKNISSLHFANLEEALQAYENLFTSVKAFPLVSTEGASLRLGDKSHRVIQLRKRLAITSELKKGGTKSDYFDQTLEEAVKLFQSHNGLPQDGIVGKTTLQALNVPLDKRIRQIKLNIERQATQTPEALGEKYVIVNIPDFKLEVFEQGQKVLAARVMVGMPAWKTPLLSSQFNNVVVNPPWTVPPGIFSKEVLGQLKKDPEYITKNQMRVFIDNKEVEDPSTVDWNTFDPQASTVKLVQTHSDESALGHLKFNFPNSYSVYLHDTPHRKLFDYPSRALSHGCMRVENPLILASVLLNKDGYSSDKIEEMIETGETRTIKINDTFGMHVVYRTAWVDEDGVLQFRNDVYGFDRIDTPKRAKKN